MPNQDFSVTVKGLSDGSLERAIGDLQNKLATLRQAASGISIGNGTPLAEASGTAPAGVVTIALGPTPANTAAGVAMSSAQTMPPVSPSNTPPPAVSPPVAHLNTPNTVQTVIYPSNAPSRGGWISDRYRDYRSAQERGFQGGYHSYLDDLHTQKLGRQQAQAERENERQDKKAQDFQNSVDRARIHAEDAGNRAQDRADDTHERARVRQTVTNTRNAFGFASMDAADMSSHVRAAFGPNPFAKYDPSLYNFGGGAGASVSLAPGVFGPPAPGGGDPLMAAGLAGLRARAALQGIINPNATNNSYNRLQQRYMGQALAGTAIQVIGGGLSLSASNVASGEIDPMAAAGYYGGTGGMVAGLFGGALLGAMAPVPEPGLGALLGSQLGLQVGTSLAQRAMAPYMQTRSAVSTLANTSARLGLDPYEIYGGMPFTMNPSLRRPYDAGHFRTGGLQDMAETISFDNKAPWTKAQIKLGLYTGTDIISGPQISQVFANFASAQMNNGNNDFGTLMDMTNRFSRKFGINAANLSATAAGVGRRSASLGDSQGDLMLQAGPEAYGLYADATGQRDFSARQLRAYGDQQRDRYNLSRADTAARGMGAAKERAGRNLLHDLTPFGTDTLAYQSAEAEQRGYRLQRFEEEGAATTGLEAARLTGQRDRFAMMPFAPGNVIRNQIAMSKNAGREAGRIGKYMQLHKGELSEEQTLQMEQRRQGQLAESWQAAAMLSEGMTNRLPALSANKPAGFERFSSWTLAAKNAAMMGIPTREWGAISGQHLRTQNALFEGMGGTAYMGNAQSMTAGFNASAETNQLLRQLISVVSGQGGMGGGGGGRPWRQDPTPDRYWEGQGRISERMTNLQGQLSRRDTGATQRWGNGN